MWKPLLTTKNIKLVSSTSWLSLRPMRQKFYSESVCAVTSGVKLSQRFIKRTSPQPLNVVVVGGAADGTMISAVKQIIQKENVPPSVCDHKIKPTYDDLNPPRPPPFLSLHPLCFSCCVSTTTTWLSSTALWNLSTVCLGCLSFVRGAPSG